MGRLRDSLLRGTSVRAGELDEIRFGIVTDTQPTRDFPNDARDLVIEITDILI